VQSKGNTRTPLEDALDSPLSLLRLITKIPDSRFYQSKPDSREGLPTGIFSYAVAEIFENRGVNALPIEDLMYSKEGYPVPGSVFRLTENASLTKLERMIHFIPGKYELRETAGIHQMYKMTDIAPIKYLSKHYRASSKEAAA